MDDNVFGIGIWVGFSLFLIAALAMETFFGSRHPEKRVSMRLAGMWTLVWIAVSLIFNLLLWLYLRQVSTPQIAAEKSLAFLTGYLIEKTLSIDNLFVFYSIFHEFTIPSRYQKRILTIGIWSAVILRLLLILTGTWLIKHFHWFIYIMGIFLLLTGIKMFFTSSRPVALSNNRLYQFLRKHLRLTKDFYGQHFFIIKNKLIYATPLFIALIFIELSDLIFASQSVALKLVADKAKAAN